MVAGSPPPKHMVGFSLSLSLSVKTHTRLCSPVSCGSPAKRTWQQFTSGGRPARVLVISSRSYRDKASDRITEGGPCNSRSRELHGQLYKVLRYLYISSVI